MGAASYHDPVYNGGGGRSEPHLNPEMVGPRGAYRQDSHSLLTPVGSADLFGVGHRPDVHTKRK